MCTNWDMFDSIEKNTEEKNETSKTKIVTKSEKQTETVNTITKSKSSLVSGTRIKINVYNNNKFFKC